MFHQSAALSSRSNSIPLADWTIGHFTSGLPRRSRCLQLGTSRTPVRLRSSPLPVESLEFHGVDPSTVPYVDAPIPVPTPVFQTSPPVADHNPIKNQLAVSRTESGGTEVWIIDRNYTPFWSNVQRRRGMYLAMIERRLQWRGKDVGAESDFVERPWLQLMCCAPVSGREVGRVFRSEGSRQDRGPKELVEGVGVDKRY